MAQKIGDMEQEGEEHKWVALVIYYHPRPGAGVVDWLCDWLESIPTKYHRDWWFFFFFYRLVIETLDPLPKDRKCFRMVNGVLVERTINDVLPALKTNSDGLKQVLEEMLKQYKTKQSELDNWKVRLHFRKSVMLGSTDLAGFTEKEQHSGRAAVGRPLTRLYYHACDFSITTLRVLFWPLKPIRRSRESGIKKN